MCIHVFNMQCCFAGSLHSYQQAFAWQRALVRSLVTNGDKPQLLSKQSHILGDMLSSHTPRHAPHLHVNSRLVLAVGAHQTSMRSTQDGLAIVAWLQQSLEVHQHSIHPCNCLCVCVCICQVFSSRNHLHRQPPASSTTCIVNHLHCTLQS